MNRSTSEFTLRLTMFLQQIFKAVFRKLMVGLSDPFFLFVVATVLIGLWFFLIPGFVSVNVQFKLIVRDKV